jgi:DNA-binding SARP family transcriptional activator
MPPEPQHAIHVRALGPLELVRDGVDVTDTDWVRRARVRDLLALVVERCTVSRPEATSLLWPDLSSDKAANNMRVTLNRLHRVLEPSRAKEDEPVIIRSDHNTLQLGEGISLDVTVFEQTLDEARGLDRSGAPAEAIALYNSALAHWRGRYLEDIDGTWLLPTQARLDSLARAAVARVGELELARGEPEVAMRWAAAGQAANSLDERCRRLMMLAMLATGDRAGALRTADDLCEALAAAGLGPSQDTVKVLHRVRQ